MNEGHSCHFKIGCPSIEWECPNQLGLMANKVLIKKNSKVNKQKLEKNNNIVYKRD